MSSVNTLSSPTLRPLGSKGRKPSPPKLRGEGAEPQGAEGLKAASCWSRLPLFRQAEELGAIFGHQFLAFLILGIVVNKGFANGLVSRATTIIFREFQIEGGRQEFLHAAIYMPWSMKPLIALASDCYPIAGYQKYYYLVGTTLAGCVGLGILAIVPASSLSIEAVALCGFLAMTTYATLDILLEGLYSRKIAAHPSKGPELVAFLYLIKSAQTFVPPLLTGFFKDTLTDSSTGVSLISPYFSQQVSFFVAWVAGLTTLYALSKGWLNEETISHAQAIENRKRMWQQRELVFLGISVGVCSLGAVIMSLQFSHQFWIPTTYEGVVVVLHASVGIFFFKPLIGKLILFKTLIQVTGWHIPGGVTNYFYLFPAEPLNSQDQPQAFYPDGPHFPEWMANIFIPIVVSLVGAFAYASYSKWGKKLRYRTLVAVTTVIAAILNASNSLLYARITKGWADWLFVIGEDALYSAVATLHWIPTFFILSRVCPDRAESTTFAVLASISNFSNKLGNHISATVGREYFHVRASPRFKEDHSERFSRLWEWNLLNVLVNLIPLLALNLLPPHRQDEEVLEKNDRISSTKGSPYQKLFGLQDRVTASGGGEEGTDCETLLTLTPQASTQSATLPDISQQRTLRRLSNTNN